MQLDALHAALVVRRLGRRGVERADVGADEVGAVGAQLLDADRQRVGELGVARLAAVDGAERARGLGDLAVEPADRPRRPVLAAQLVEHGAVDARPQELLERGALGGVVAVDRGDERLEPARDVVVGLLVGGDLADLAVDDVLDQRRVGHDQPVPQPRIVRGLVALPEGQSLDLREPLRRRLPGCRRCRHSVGMPDTVRAYTSRYFAVGCTIHLRAGPSLPLARAVWRSSRPIGPAASARQFTAPSASSASARSTSSGAWWKAPRRSSSS